MIRKFPSVFTLVFITTGVLIADQSRLSSWIFLSACLLFCVMGFFSMERRGGAIAGLLFGVALLFFSAFHFAWRYYDAGPHHVSRLKVFDHRLQMFGRVADWPDLRPGRTDFKIELDSIVDGTVRRVDGAVLLRVSDTSTAFQRGDRIEFFGRIYPVRERELSTGSDYQRHLNLKGVFGIVYLPTILDVRLDKRNRYALIPLADQLRDAIRESLRRNLTGDAAALTSGILIGETRDIPVSTYLRFRDSGTLHLLAVSGSNVALIILFFVVLLKPLGLKPAGRAAILLPVILMFTLLSYGEPSVVRASVMAGLVLFAGLIQRKYDLNNIIATAACIILLFDPAQLFDIGFQLSFTIAWGLIFILPRVTALFRSVYHRWWYRWLVFPLLVSLLAQVCSAGLTAYHFGRVPLIAPIANLIVVPLVSIAVVGSLILLVADLILPLLGAFVGAWLNLFLESVSGLVTLLGDETIPAIKIAELSAWLAAAFYLHLFLGALTIKSRVMRRVLVITLSLALNLALLSMILSGRTRQASAHVHLFSVPGGIAAVVKDPESVTADLVITGIHGKTYPIDERIINPELSRLEASRLNSLFVISARYDAIDDILRTARKYGGERVFVDNSLKPSFQDVARLMSDTVIRIQPMHSTDVGRPAGKADCYFCCTEAGLMFVADGSKVVFANRLMPEHFQARSDSLMTCLVVGSSWRMSLGDLEDLRLSGYRRIYCSKMEQRISNELPAGYGGPAPALPTYVFDLSRRGSVTLAL